ncbi:hypothetical protein [Vibrio vulnificus]|uniref:hypothetical protein n=1 Tax=Vibrio vulnificus TaxID=672 RepID=UPI00215CA8CF|nr:hypothetical protein [Vibrio vulnificus]MCR9498434.1 hypothetical protein [Vibrio vulnificus]
MYNRLHDFDSEIDSIVYDYERFVMHTSHLPHLGLYHKDNFLFCVIDGIDPIEAKTHAKNYDERYRTICNPSPLIVPKIEDDFKKIHFRDAWKKINDHGHPYTHPEIENELYLKLPKKFHPFIFDYKMDTGNFRLELEFTPTLDEISELELLLSDLGLDNYKLIVVKNTEIREQLEIKRREQGKLSTILKHDPHALILKASGLLGNNIPRLVLEKYEEDQDFWVDHKMEIFREIDFNKKDITQLKNFDIKGSCFVDATFHDRNNLRTYIALYKTVIIALPQNTREKRQTFFEMFNITEFEMKILIKNGRIKFSILDNLNLYSLELIDSILEVDPSAIIFPRSIAASCLISMRERTGLLGYSYTTDEQFRFLNALHNSNNRHERLANALSDSWYGMESLVNQNGLALIGHIGVGGLLSRMHFDSDDSLAFYSASYEIAQGLGAHYFPFESSNEPRYIKASEIVSSVYHGVDKNSAVVRESRLNSLLNSVYTVDNDMNILDLDRIFSHKEIPYASDILQNWSSLTQDEIDHKLLKLREDISKLESNQRRISSLDFSGFIGGIAAYATDKPAVSLLVWGLLVTSNYLKLTQAETEAFTRLAALNNRVDRDVVLIKNSRDKLATK